MDFLRLLSEYRNPVLDIIFQSATWLAQETLVVVIICWLYWCKNKKLAYTLGFTYFISGLLVQGLKITFRIPRPWVLDPGFQAVSSALPGATGYSFPSGHTQSGTALFSTLGFAAKKTQLRFVCFFMIIFIGFSRMYLGVHTPKDVLVSMSVTLLISLMVYYLLRSRLEDPSLTGKISILLLAACILLGIYTGVLYGETRILEQKFATDCFKACSAGLGFALGFYLERRYICFSLPRTAKEKALRFGAGLLSVLLLMGILEITIKRFWAGDIISYFLLILWIVAFYPAVFSYAAHKQGQ